MKHYRNPNSGEVFAYDTQAEREMYGAPELVTMSDEEVAQHHAPPSAPAVPREVTRRQGRQALLLAGLLHQVQPAIDAIEDPTQRALMQIEWEDAQTFQRDRPQLIALARALGLDDPSLDALFQQASTL